MAPRSVPSNVQAESSTSAAEDFSTVLSGVQQSADTPAQFGGASSSLAPESAPSPETYEKAQSDSSVSCTTARKPVKKGLDKAPEEKNRHSQQETSPTVLPLAPPELRQLPEASSSQVPNAGVGNAEPVIKVTESARGESEPPQAQLENGLSSAISSFNSKNTLKIESAQNVQQSPGGMTTRSHSTPHVAPGAIQGMGQTTTSADSKVSARRAERAALQSDDCQADDASSARADGIVLHESDTTTESRSTHPLTNETAGANSTHPVRDMQQSTSNRTAPIQHEQFASVSTPLTINTSQAESAPTVHVSTVILGGLQPDHRSPFPPIPPERKDEHIASAVSVTSANPAISDARLPANMPGVEQPPYVAEVRNRSAESESSGVTQPGQASPAGSEKRTRPESDAPHAFTTAVDVSAMRNQHDPAGAQRAATESTGEAVSKESPQTLDSYPQFVHDGKLIQQMSGSEWRVGLHVPDIGRVEIKTNTHDGATQAQLSVERPDVHRMFEANEAELGTALARHNVEFSGTSLMQGSTSSGEEQRQAPWRYTQERHDSSREQRSTPALRIPEPANQARSSYSGGGLNILA